MRIEKRNDGRAWAVIDSTGELVCLTLYKKGAAEVVKRLTGRVPVCVGGDQQQNHEEADERKRPYLARRF